MKSLDELKKLLETDIQTIKKTLIDERDDLGLNQKIGDSSILLTSILQENLLTQTNWGTSKWLDDIIVNRIKIVREKVIFWGVDIWGKLETTKQWTDPVYIDIFIENENFKIKELKFLFKDENKSSISYREYTNQRRYWSDNYYLDDDWNPLEKKWKYCLKTRSDR